MSFFPDLLHELTAALKPLIDAGSDPWMLDQLLAQVAVDASQLGASGFVTQLAAIGPAVSQLEAAIANPPDTLAAVGAALDATRTLVNAVSALTNGLPAGSEQLASDLVQLVVLRYFAHRWPLGYQLAIAAGVIGRGLTQVGGIVPARMPTDLVLWANLEQLFRDPVGALCDQFPAHPLATVEDVHTTMDVAVARFGGLTTALGIPWRYGYDPEDAAALGDYAPRLDHAVLLLAPRSWTDQPLGVVVTLSSADRDDLGIVLAPFGAFAIERDLDRFHLSVQGSAGIQAVAFGGGKGFQVLATSGAVDASLAVTLSQAPASDRGPYVVGTAKGTRLELQGTTLHAAVALAAAARTVDLGIDIPSVVLVLTADGGDGFLSSIIGNGELRTTIDFGLSYATGKGLHLKSGTGLTVTLPVALSTGPLKLEQVALTLAPTEQAVEVTVAATLALTIGPVAVTVQDMGVRTTATLPSTSPPRAFDLDVGFKTPTGVGLAVDAPVVRGGGFLRHEPELDRYSGALHVTIGGTIDLAAWGVLQSGSGTRHWSLAVFLAGHIPPIELGWNFRLTALGGMLALHHRMDTDALRDAAYGIRGSLDDLLFPDSPETRLPQLLSTMERFFPPAVGSYVAGPMVEIDWGRAGQVNARIRAALLLQLDDEKVAFYGTVRIGFPRLDADSTLRVRAAIEALVDPHRMMARFSITIIEAKLFDSIRFTGGAAFFVRWGSGRTFAFTAGGFHPSYRLYIPSGLVEPPRIGVHWNPVSGVRLDLTQYFAITTTSMQFGAAAHAEVGCSWGQVTGDFSYDFLVMTSPALHMEAGLHARVTVTVFGADLLTAGLDGSLAGPGPWVFSGTVSWSIWIFDISKSFHFEWGDHASVSATPQSAGQILAAELQSPGSWTSSRTRPLPVRVRSGVSAPLAPSDEIEVRQSRLPFGTRVETYEGNPLSDAGVWLLTTSSLSGLVKLGEVTEVFPERRFLARPSTERPFRGGLVCGARLARTDWDVPAVAVAVDSTETDDVVVDGGVTVAGAVGLPVPTLADAVLGALPTASRVRAFPRGAAILEAVS